MLRLYLRFYLALLASLVVLGCATALLWHLLGTPVQSGATLSRLIENVLPPPSAPAAEQQAALGHLTAGVHGDVTLLAGDGTVLAAVGSPLHALRPMPRHVVWSAHWGGGGLSSVRLADGRLLVTDTALGSARARALAHLWLIALVVAIGAAAYPIFRQITARLERLQGGVDSLGAGDLSARVAVEGHDEVARLAESFNRAAARIEELVKSHRTLLAQASHELRTPLARIRLALELSKGTADPKIHAGLEQDIAELDGLVEEILLAARLDAVHAPECVEDFDLLALAAEECARYDAVQLEGSTQILRGEVRLLRRLLRNLLENAQRHGAPPTQMRISRHGEFAQLRVWDAGSGPDRADLENVFTPFHRRRDAPSGPGVGLGLSLVRQIAQRHGGDARCEMIDDTRSGFLVTLRLAKP